MTPEQRRVFNALAAAVYEQARRRGADKLRFVGIETSDGSVTVAECAGCGLLDPDINPLHDSCPGQSGQRKTSPNALLRRKCRRAQERGR